MNVSGEFGLPDFVKATDLLPLELNYYGAAKMVADRLGIKNPPVSYVSWTHGWKPEDITEAKQLAYDTHVGVSGDAGAKITIPAQKRRPYLVATKAYETLLRENGYPDSKAVGLPFSYVDPDPTTRRIPGSLLVMPAHVLMRMEGRANEIEYLDYIQSIAPQFSRVVFCINLGCMVSGLWIENLEKYGFDYLFGAGMMDQMALFRMRKLFDTFEYMTSNGIGSHFVYAGLCGVKVSLAGPLDKFPLDLFKNEPEWQDLERRKTVIAAAQMHQHSFLQQKFPWLYVEPRDGVECIEWAREEIGYYNRVSFEQLAQLFGWDVTAQKPESLLDVVLRLDGDDRFAELLHFIQATPHPVAEMVAATVHLLARNRLRPAYLLAMLLTKRGQQHAAISLALSAGGLVYNNPTEAAQGLAHLSALVHGLSVEQQRLFTDQLVAPLLSPLLVAAVGGSGSSSLESLLAVVRAAVPAMGSLLHQQGMNDAQRLREEASQVLRYWQQGK
ncbi:MAG: hypothetical protein HQL90_04475 [Magnetococcales bacterium]|nr:hypothetical protein [Magnetococcales bacterium]